MSVSAILQELRIMGNVCLQSKDTPLQDSKEMHFHYFRTEEDGSQDSQAT